MPSSSSSGTSNIHLSTALATAEAFPPPMAPASNVRTWAAQRARSSVRVAADHRAVGVRESVRSRCKQGKKSTRACVCV